MAKKRECELKYKLQDIEHQNKLVNKLISLGFTKSFSILESDFILDTDSRQCRMNSFLFRIRYEMNLFNGFPRIIYTFKIKNKSVIIQDNCEIEFDSRSKSYKDLEVIVQELYRITGIKLTEQDFLVCNIVDIIRHLSLCGFSHCEIMQKKREHYTNNTVQVEFDSFPDNIGLYMEIEAYSEEDLLSMVSALDMSINDMDNRNYGQIILENNNGICVYNDKIIKLQNHNFVSAMDILKMM